MMSVLFQRLSTVLVLTGTLASGSFADVAAPSAVPLPPASAAPATPEWGGADAEPAPSEETSRESHRHWHRHHDHRDGNVISIGRDSTLEEGQKAQSVVSVVGSSTSAGEAVTVVSIVGDTTVTGSVQDAAVAVLGNTSVDGKVEGDVVAVLGSVTLGPHAEVGGDVVSVLGTIKRDPAAVVHGGVQSVLATNFGDFTGLRTWISQCVLYARPLAPAAGLGWAWSLALVFFALYVFLALVFREALGRCVATLDSQPGQTLLAAIIAALLAPVLIVLLCITVIGIAAVPFAALALLCLGLFGKAVSLAWLGGRIIGRAPTGALRQPVFAVLVGGTIALVLYIVPVVGFLVYNLLGIMGFGAVVYTLILAFQQRQAARMLATGAGKPAATAAAAAAETAAPSAPASDDIGVATPAQDFTSASTASASAASAPSPISASASASAASVVPPLTSQAVASLPRAGFWIRMAALFIDVLLVGFGLGLLHDGFHSHLIILATYGAVMWKLRGSTVGGIVFDLKVVQTDGRPLDWQIAIVRALGCFLSLAVAGLGFIWIALDPGNQSWHDKIAGTIVVRVPKGTPQG